MPSADSDVKLAIAGDARAFARLVEPHRAELRAHCYRLSGSLGDAEELVQESLLRAWKGLAAFEGRASVRTWLYKIATNVCLDAIASRPPKSLPTEHGYVIERVEQIGAPEREPVWLEPFPDALLVDSPASPEARYGQRESVALAFLVALQLLPVKQRAVLILRDVVGFEAAECAELLSLSVAAVKSALQRARDAVEAHAAQGHGDPAELDAPTRTLLARYVDAWERADPAALVSLLHEDVVLSMPPFRECLRGPRGVAAAIDTKVFRDRGRAGIRLVPTRANGLPAFGAYYRDERGVLVGGGVYLVEVRDGRVGRIVAFLDPRLVTRFGLPETIEDLRGAAIAPS